MIPEDKIAEIRERTDIVALVGEYVPLRRAGSSFKGLCPFHAEKTPSFHVHPGRQFFHCFGCHASGDVFSFLTRLEGRAFPEIARSLAERAGVEIPALDAQEDAQYRQARQRDERLAALMDAAAGFYVRQLTEHPLGRMARDELEKRGLSRDTVQTFRLGYAPHGWDALLGFLRAQGFSPADAEAVGLIVPRRSGEGHYDRFRHRLLFPITDLHGRIVAFSGRQLEPPDGDESSHTPAKYVNSPEGPLYKKGEILFGLHEGRVETRRQGWVILCEGNFDLLALHQAGFRNAVAPMGTAVTEAHAKLLRRFASRVVLLFDGDAAGRRAVREAYPLLAKQAVGAQVVTLPAGEDPDTFLRSHGAEALSERMAAAPGVIEFLIDDAAAATSGDPRSMAEAIESLGPVLALVDSPIEAGLYVERVARKFGIADVERVREQLRRGVRAARGRPPARGRATTSRPGRRNDAPRQTPSLPPLQSELVGAIIEFPELVRSADAEKLGELLTSPEIRAIFLAVSRMARSREAVDGPALLAELDGNPACEWLEKRLAVDTYGDIEGARRALRDGVPRLAKRNIERELPRLGQLILEARREGNDARADELMHERDALFRSSNQWMQGTKG